MRPAHRRGGAGIGHLTSRRGFLRALAGGALALLGAPLLPRRGRAAAPDAKLQALLASSRLVYISPLRADGSESTCHAELWYAWLDGAVVVTVASDGWKARAVARGLDRARIWVGDHGRWKRLGIESDAFRSAPHLDARAERVRDPALLERLLTAYGHKYPQEIGRWRERMRQGYRDGTRVLLRYTPL